MSIAFKNWVMEEQEKDMDRMITEIKHQEHLTTIKQTIRNVLNEETLTINAREKLNSVIKNINTEIIRIEKIVSEHEQYQNTGEPNEN